MDRTLETGSVGPTVSVGEAGSNRRRFVCSVLVVCLVASFAACEPATVKIKINAVEHQFETRTDAPEETIREAIYATGRRLEEDGIVVPVGHADRKLQDRWRFSEASGEGGELQWTGTYSRYRGGIRRTRGKGAAVSWSSRHPSDAKMIRKVLVEELEAAGYRCWGPGY